MSRESEKWSYVNASGALWARDTPWCSPTLARETVLRPASLLRTSDLKIILIFDTDCEQRKGGENLTPQVADMKCEILRPQSHGAKERKTVCEMVCHVCDSPNCAVCELRLDIIATNSWRLYLNFAKIRSFAHSLKYERNLPLRTDKGIFCDCTYEVCSKGKPNSRLWNVGVMFYK